MLEFKFGMLIMVQISMSELQMEKRLSLIVGVRMIFLLRSTSILIMKR